MYKCYTLLALAFLSSCGTKINYLGKTSAATQSVDVYVDAAAIKRPYSIIGKGYVAGISYSKSIVEKIQKKAIQKAKEKGADAILFRDYYIMQDGGAVYSITGSDSTGHGMAGIRNATAAPVVSSQRDILFLKYE
jgi:hypothetical protein